MDPGPVNPDKGHAKRSGTEQIKVPNNGSVMPNYKTCVFEKLGSTVITSRYRT